jgi:hypothetical protein
MQLTQVTQFVEHRYDYGWQIDALIFVAICFLASGSVALVSLARYLTWLMEDTESDEEQSS